MSRRDDGRCQTRRSFIEAAAAAGIAGGVAGCTDGGPLGSGSGDDGPVAPVRQIARGYRSDDVDAVRRATHPDSPLLETLTEREVQNVDVEVASAEVVRREDGSAVVHAELELSGGNNAPQGTTDFTAETRTHQGSWMLWQLRQGRPTPTRTPGETADPTETATETDAPDETDEPTPSGDALFYDGFEGSLDGWEVHESEWGRTADAAYDGQYSAGVSARGTVSAIASVDLGAGERVGRVGYYWKETAGSYGGGLRLFNSADRLEIGTASDNPQWVVDDADGVRTVDGGSDYGNWIRTEVDFDWDEGVAAVRFADTASGASYSEVHPLKAGRDVRRVELTAFTSDNGWQSGSCQMYWDELRVEE